MPLLTGMLAAMTWGVAACENPVDSKITLPGGLEQVFRAPIDDAFPFEWLPATDGQRLYEVIVHKMRAFDLSTGQELWSHDLGGQGIVARGNRVFWNANTTYDTGTAVAAAAESGSELWRFDFPGSTFTNGDTDGEAYYFGTDAHRVFALNATDGSLRWSTDVGPDWAYRGIVRGTRVSGDTVYVVAERYMAESGYIGQAEIFALDAATGAILWRFVYGDGTRRSVGQSAPRVAGRLLLVEINWEDTVVAIDRFTGQEVWHLMSPGDSFGPSEAPETDGEVAYVASFPYTTAIDVATGNIRWRSTGQIGSAFYMAICGNRLLVEDQAINIFDLRTGEFLGRLDYRLGATNGSPQTDFVVVGNVAYVLMTDSLLALRCPT